MTDLVIVESPNKIQKISKYLGDGYEVVATVGHFRDLPVSRELSVVFDETNQSVCPKYAIYDEKKDVVTRMKKAAYRAETIYLATDPDREGEAIAWHVIETLRLPIERVRRATFQSITKQAVQDAIDDAGPLNMHLVNAQQARRVLDRVVGWCVSPVCAKGTGDKRAKSAGRVQSVALRILAQRELEISTFQPQKYFDIFVLFPDGQSDKGPYDGFQAKLIQWNGQQVSKNRSITTAEMVQEIITYLCSQPATVVGSEISERSIKPRPPYTTMTAQVDFRTKLQTSSKDSMAILQKLFEKGLITYHRTDSTFINPDTIDLIRSAITALYGANQCPEDPITHQISKNAQEGHEAIHPTNLRIMTQKASGLDTDLWKHYEMIWKRTVASQMAPGINLASELVIRHGSACAEPSDEVRSRIRGSIIVEEGFRSLYSINEVESGKDDPEANPQGVEEALDARVPPLSTETPLTVKKVTSKEAMTRPPPRYSDASLTKAMEKNGVGRPSTYASIHQTLQNRCYALLEGKSSKYKVTPLGMSLIDFLTPAFAQDFIEVSYTKDIEHCLDDIAAGGLEWESFIVKVSRKLVNLAITNGLGYDPLKGEMPARPEREPDPRADPCPLCSGPMTHVVTKKQHELFVCLKGKDVCGGMRDINNRAILPLKPDPAADPCPLCGKAMARQEPRDPSRSAFYRCMDKKCEGRRNLDQSVWGKAAVDTTVRCPLCNAGMIQYTNRQTNEPFYLCEHSKRKRLPCIGSRKADQTPNFKPAPEGVLCPNKSCGKPMVWAAGKPGGVPFYRCSKKSCKGLRHIEE